MSSLPSYIYGILLTKAYRTLRTGAYDTLDRYGLIPSEWSLIGIVSEAVDGITSSLIAERLGVKTPLITVMIDSLVAKDIVKRVTNEADGRSKLIYITEHGHSLVKEVENALNKDMSPLLRNITSEELRVFQKVLSTISANEYN